MARTTILIGVVAMLSGVGLLLAGCAVPEPAVGYPASPYGYGYEGGYPPGYAYYPPDHLDGPGFVGGFSGFGFGVGRFRDEDRHHHREHDEVHRREHDRGSHPKPVSGSTRSPMAHHAMTPHGHTAAAGGAPRGGGYHGSGHDGSGGHHHE